MKNRISKLALIVLASVVLALGFLLGKLVSVPGLEVDKSISLTHAASILVTIVVAVVISVLIDGIKEQKKLTREVVIPMVDKLIIHVDNTKETLLKGSLPLATANSFGKKIIVPLSHVKNAVVAKNKTAIDLFDDLESMVKEIRVNLTETPQKNSNPSEHPVIVNPKLGYIYSDKRTDQIEVLLDNLNNNLLKLQLSDSYCK